MIFFRWKETQWNTNQQSVHSQVSAMNAATAQMVTLTGHGERTDHNAVGAAVNTISTNLPDMAREVKMLAALMDDRSLEGDDLMGAARLLCGAFSEMLSAAEPETNEVIIYISSMDAKLSARLESVLSQTEKSCIASNYRQSFTNIKIKIIKLIPVLLNQAFVPSENKMVSII